MKYVDRSWGELRICYRSSVVAILSSRALDSLTMGPRGRLLSASMKYYVNAISLWLPFASVLEKIGGKEAVMRHLAHEDPNVRYEALLSVQKLMVHNW